MHVDNFEMTRSASSPITIGNGSDVCFDKIPHDFLEVFVEKDLIRWNVNERYRNTDSLWYYKINNENPNIHALAPNDRITVPTENGVAEISVAEIYDMLKDVKNEYVMVRNLLGKKQIELDTTFYAGHDFTQDRRIKSFIYRKKSKVLNKMGECQLVILDCRTKLHHENEEIGYTMSGTNSTYGGTAKIQFFRMAPAAYRETKVNKKYFAIKDINYVAKPVLLTTGWGAGHILLKRGEEGNKLDCYFPKPVTYIERIEELKKTSTKSSGMLTYCQADNGFPTGSVLTMPEFSSQASMDLCNLRFSDDSILCNNEVITSERHCIPSLNKMKVGVDNEIGVRMGIMDKSYFWSCLCMPIVILIFCIVSYILFLKLCKIREDSTCEKIKGRSAENLPSYLTAVFLILFTYIVCRIMIAVKLGYTFPFFENIFGINVVSVCLLLMLVYGLSGLINIKFIVAERNKLTKLWPFMFPLFHIIGMAICCITFSKMSDAHSYSVLQSYLPGEVNNNILSFSNWNFWNWDDMNGMKDVFFNIPYVLFLANLAIFALTIVEIFISFVKKQTLAEMIFSSIKKKFEPNGDMQDKVFLRNLKAALLPYVVVGCVLILFTFFLSGNYATAMITFLVIVFMSEAFLQVRLCKGMTFLKAMFCYLLISVLFLFVACAWKDAGYITNALGFIMFAFFTYVITEKEFEPKPGWNGEKGLLVAGFVTMVIVFFFAINHFSSNSSLERFDRRASMVTNWDGYANSGYRHAESDAEFMRVLKHYMFSKEFVSSDPLSSDDHILHPSISSGQAPVILNDLSIQSCFFGSYGILTYFVYFALLILLCCLVLSNTVWKNGIIGRWVYWRALAMFMWVGTSLYLFLSYMGVLPFTGRLNPGFGVDSVGEALETSILMAFMLAANPYRENDENR
jgi:hypothetical protein